MRLGPLSALIVITAPVWPQPAPAQGQPEIASEEAPITFSSRVNLISVPVVVRDRDGHPVGNLTRENFQLFDKGKLQIITKFSVEKTEGIAEIPAPGASAPRERAQAPAPSPSVLPESYVAYLVDDVHLKSGDLLQARQAMHRHLDESIDPTSRAAIFTTSGLALSEFTADRQKLHNAINKIQPYTSGIDRQQDCPYISYYVADMLVNQKLYLDGRLFPDAQLDQVAQSGTEPELTAAYAEAKACVGTCGSGKDTLSGLPLCEVETLTKLRVSARQALTYGDHETSLGLGALRDVVRKLSAMPGKRNLVLVSPGFLLTRDTRTDEYDVLDRAIRASVVVNTIDMRGLFAIIPGGDASSPAFHSSAAITQLSLAEMAAATQADDVLAELASGTGGTFFHDDNDLKSGLNLIAARPEFVYVLGFSPPDLKLDGAYHGLKVTIKNAANLTIQARRGYWAPNHAVDPAEVAKEEIQETVFSRDEIQAIPVELETEYFKTGDFKAELTVSARVNVQSLRFQKDDDRSNDSLTVVTGLFDANGNYISGIQRLLKLHLRDQTLAALENSGIHVEETFQVAAPGRYVIRLVVRDSGGSAITARNGGVQIP
jgi:VWFA-related protein